MKSRERVLRTICVCLILCVATTNLGAATVYVDDIQISLVQGRWYHGDVSYGQDDRYFQPADLSGQNPDVMILGEALLSTVNSTEYEYRFNGTFHLDICSLDEDMSENGVAEGLFEGAAVLTIIGDLWHKDTPENKIVNNGTILVALMASELWTLKEVSPPMTNTVRGGPSFSPTGGALYDGAGPEELTLVDFEAGFQFQFCTPSVTSFSSTSYSSLIPSVQITAIPEPVSVLLLGIGGLTVFRSNRRVRIRP
jgi:hypothetical protein